MKEVTIEEFMKQCENLQETADELYIKGFDNGKEHGRDEAWECARKIADMDWEDCQRIFSLVQLDNIVFDFTAEEAIQKIKDYEKRKNDNLYMHIYGQTLEEMKEDRGKWKLSNSTATECEKCAYSTQDGLCQYDDITEVIPPIEHKCDTCQKFGDECDGHAFGCKDYEELDFVQEHPTIPITITAMRDATPEELKGVHDYIKSISTKTGVNFYDNL